MAVIIHTDEGYSWVDNPFKPELALANEPVAITVTEEGQPVTKLVESIERKSKTGSNSYYYQVLADGKWYTFNESGNGNEMGSISNTATLNMLEGTINAEGGRSGDTLTITKGGASKYFNLTSLNYRESVAVQVLNALINHFDNPLSYSNATIKLLVGKAFDFSKEFTNQATDLRTENAEPIRDPTTQQIVDYEIDDSSSAPVLTSIANQLENLNSALRYTAPTLGAPTESITKKLHDILVQDTAIKVALDGTGTSDTTSVSKRLATIATAEGNINTSMGNINTSIDTINTSLGNINTSVDNIHTDFSTETNASGIVRAIKSGANTIKSGEDNIAEVLEGKVTAPAVTLIIEGTLDTTNVMLFGSNTGQPNLDAAITAYQNGQPVMLKYSSTGFLHLDTVTYADLTRKVLKTQAGVYWANSSSYSVVVVGNLNNFNQFYPTQGGSFSQTVTSFKNGTPIYLYYNSTNHPVTVYSYDTAYYLADSNGVRWYGSN